MSHYNMRTHEDELKRKCFLCIVKIRLFLKNKVGKIDPHFGGVSNWRSLDIVANSALRASLAIHRLISNARSWKHCKLHYSIITNQSADRLTPHAH